MMSKLLLAMLFACAVTATATARADSASSSGAPGPWSVLAPPPDAVRHLIEQEDRLTEVCSDGDDTDGRLGAQACALRDAYFGAIERMGWCFGETYQVEADKIWHPCHH